MVSRHFYQPVRSADDTENTLNSPVGMHWWQCAVPRRKNTVIIGGLLLVAVCATLLPYTQLHEHLQEYVHSNSTANTQPDTPTIASPAGSVVECLNTPAVTTPNVSIASHAVPGTISEVRWSDFAYVQYVTNTKYLCNSLMIFEALRHHNTKADLLMMYPNQWNEPEEVTTDTPYESKLLVQARDEYKVNLVPIQVKTFTDVDDPTWQDSYTKLLAFNQTQYKRLVSLDSDATVLDVGSLKPLTSCANVVLAYGRTLLPPFCAGCYASRVLAGQILPL
jgi:hypothetical protein